MRYLRKLQYLFQVFFLLFYLLITKPFSIYFNQTVHKNVGNLKKWEINNNGTCARASFLIKLLVSAWQKRLWYRCFPVIFMKFLRTRFLQNTSGRLLLLLNAIEIWINLEIIIVEIKKKIEWRNFLVSRDKNYYQFGQILRKLRKFIRIKKKKKMEGSSPGAEFFSGGNSPG